MKLLLSSVAAAAVAIMLATAAVAGPQQASGAGTATAPVLRNVRQADGNVVADFTQQAVVGGTFTGTLDAVGHVVVHPDGTTNTEAFVTFTGTTPCGAGTVVFEANSRTVAGVGAGHGATIDAAGNTAGIQSEIDLMFALPAFTYSGTYHCM